MSSLVTNKMQGRGIKTSMSGQILPQRFRPSTVAHSGVNSLGAFSAFMKRDPITNIDIRRDEKKRPNPKEEFPYMKDRVPSGTQTFTFLTNKLGNNGKLNRDRIESREAPRSKTDHVSYDPPQANKT